MSVVELLIRIGGVVLVEIFLAWLRSRGFLP
jgi:hypothetical protein